MCSRMLAGTVDADRVLREAVAVSATAATAPAMAATATSEPVVAVVIPAYRVIDHVLDVLARIGPEVGIVVVVDDCCPDGSGRHVLDHCRDSRVHVVFHDMNLGVGGAMVTGYREAARRGATVLVKVDGDGQMDPAGIFRLAAPVLNGSADYAKGNRFFSPDNLRGMPLARLLGNAGLSFLTKLSSGYWTVFDPTNGFTALHASLLPLLALHRMEQRYFFESEMLFRLRLVNARVVDVPMRAQYGPERSNLNVRRALWDFLLKNLRNMVKRFTYMYLVRDFSVATLYMLLGLPLAVGGLVFGIYSWAELSTNGVFASSGTVMLAALPLLVGTQLLLAFVAYDVEHVPRDPVHRLLETGSLSHLYDV